MSYGHIVLSNNKSGFIPKAIKWFTDSSYSHSLITTPPILDVPMGIEAAEYGVDSVRFDKNYVDDNTQAYQMWIVKIDQYKKDDAIRYILNDLQIMYGYLEYPWFIWRKINKWFGRDIKKQNNWNTGGMICSQLCVAYLTACGLGDLFKDYGKGSVAPQDLYNIMIANPELFELVEQKWP